MTTSLRRLILCGARHFKGIHTTSNIKSRSYDGPGKTTATVLNRDFTVGLSIDGWSKIGFHLNNGLNIIGPMIIFPRSVLSWDIASFMDINEKTLALFKILEPKLDILVVGLDKNYPPTTPFIRNIREIMGKENITVEILPTEHACPTFNFLNNEGRFVAACLIPPEKHIKPGIVQIESLAARVAHDAELTFGDYK